MNCRVLSIQSHVVSGYVGNKAATFPLQVSDCMFDHMFDHVLVFRTVVKRESANVRKLVNKVL